MAKRYLPGKRNTNTGDLNAIRDRFINDLNKEADALFKNYTKLLADAFKSTLDGSGGVSEAGLTNFIAAAAKYATNSTIKTSSNTRETARSKEVESRFKLSDAQSLAEAGNLISKGDKNL